MAVPHCFVPVPMNVGLTGWIVRTMFVLVVFVVHVFMFVFHFVVFMFMIVNFGEVQIKSYPH